MKTPIEPSEIKAGDLIRWEKGDDSPNQAFKACEFIASVNGEGRRNYDGRHYLLDRPKPTVELPTEVGHHFGWLTAPNSRVSGCAPGEWHFNEESITASGFPEPISRDKVTGFIPGTLVQTEALDELRNAWVGWGGRPPAVVSTFLAAVDAAGDRA